jgi:hypothetical protein
MPRMYSAVFEGVTVSAVQDFFELTAASTCVVAIHEIHITQDDNETSQQLPVRILRVPATVTGGSGGSTPTPRKIGGVGLPAAASVVEVNNTTPATTSGTLETLRRQGDNVLNGWHWVFTPETRIYIPPSGVVVVRLVTAPSAGIPMSGELIFEELG